MWQSSNSVNSRRDVSRLSGGGTSFDDACDAGAQNLEPRAVQQTLILTSVGGVLGACASYDKPCAADGRWPVFISFQVQYV